jgi:hypothetical protein
MDSIYDFISTNLDDEIKNQNVFYFDGKQIKAVAFKQGCKCDCISKIKKAIKGWGFKYDYDFDAYLYKDKKDETYRIEKNVFISSLIEWKIKKTKTSKNGKNTEKLFFQGF